MPDTDDALLSDITDILRDMFEEDDLVVTAEYSRQNNEHWDSMNHLNIIFALESKYRIKFGVVDIEEIQNVGDLIRLVKKKTGKA
ncbi:MAG: acyl carrier protein [Rhodospirillales bacterium]|nr:acyl carrier protein [Rhodospirillales bacterium]